MAAVDYEQIARFYDCVVESTEDLEFFLDQGRRTPGPVVELMAGTGRLSVPLATAGVDLTCVDSSAAMLRVLERKLDAHRTRARIVRQDVSTLDLGTRFALAFIAFHSFEELVSDAERNRALRGVLDHLVPGGRFICTLHDPEVRLRDVGPGRDREIRFRDATGRDILLTLQTGYDEAASVVSGRERMEDAITGEVLVDLPLRFRLTPAAEFRGLADEAGFTVDALYGDFDGEPYVEGRSATLVWVLSRPVA